MLRQWGAEFAKLLSPLLDEPRARHSDVQAEPGTRRHPPAREDELAGDVQQGSKPGFT